MSTLLLPWKQSLPWKFSRQGGQPLPPTPRLVRQWLLVDLVLLLITDFILLCALPMTGPRDSSRYPFLWVSVSSWCWSLRIYRLETLGAPPKWPGNASAAQPDCCLLYLCKRKKHKNGRKSVKFFQVRTQKFWWSCLGRNSKNISTKPTNLQALNLCLEYSGIARLHIF